VPAVDRYVLDTSAVLALTDQEDGWEQAEELLNRATDGEIEVVICAVSLMELYYITLQEQGEDPAARLRRRTVSPTESSREGRAQRGLRPSTSRRLHGTNRSGIPLDGIRVTE